jgi:hypothetical protein
MSTVPAPRSRPRGDSVVSVSKVVVRLTVLLALVVAVAAAIGLFASGGPGPHGTTPGSSGSATAAPTR